MTRGLPLCTNTGIVLVLLLTSFQSFAQKYPANGRLRNAPEGIAVKTVPALAAGRQSQALATTYYVNDLNPVGNFYTSAGAIGNDGNPGTMSQPFLTINHAIQVASSGDVILVDPGIYTENVIVNKGVTLNGRQASQPVSTRYAAFVLNKANPTQESVIMPSQNNPIATNPNANDLVRVQANNITVNGFTIDGNNPLLGTSDQVDSGSTYIHARRGITNIDVADGYNPVNGLSVQYNIIQNVAQRCVSLNNGGGAVSTGNTIDRNLFRTFGTDPNIGGIGVILLENAYANITNNTVYVPPGQVGLEMENFSTNGTGTWSGNNVTVGQGALGINANLFYASAISLTITNNTVNAASGVTDGVDGVTWGINAWSMLSGSTVSITNNTVGATGGQFAHGINLWNLPTTTTVTVSGGTVGNSAVGVDLDNVDPYYGGGQTTVVNLTGLAITGGTTGIRTRVSTLTFPPLYAANTVTGSTTINVSNTTVNGATNGSVSNAPMASAPYFARTQFNSPASTITNATVPVLIDGDQAQVVAGAVNLTVPPSGPNNAIVFQNISASAITNLFLAGGLNVNLNNNNQARAFASPTGSIVEVTGAWTAPTPTAIGAPNSVFINGKLYFTAGILNSGGGSIEFGTTATDIVNAALTPKPEFNTSYLLGQALMDARPVGKGAFDFLGVVLDDASGEGNADVGSLTIGRTTTTGPINPPYPNDASIHTVWQITPTNTSASRGNVHFRYLDALKNFQNPNNIFAYRYTAGAWQRISASLMSTRVGDIYTTAAFAAPSFSPWTLSSDIPPVLPDLVPTVDIQSATYTAQGQSRDFIVNVNEVAGGTTTGQVTVTILKSARFNYTFNPSQTTATYFGPQTVNNPDYEVVTDNASVLQLRTKEGVSIGAFGTSKIAIGLQLKTGDNTSGTVNQQVFLNGGGETTTTNNSVFRTLAISL